MKNREWKEDEKGGWSDINDWKKKIREKNEHKFD